MKLLKKCLAIALVLSMSAVFLSACGSSSNSSTSSSGTTTASSGGTTETNDGKVYRLSVTIHDTAEAPKTQYVQKWADAVNEASGGRLEITVYGGGTIAGSSEALDAVKQGTADIGVCYSGFFPGQFDLSDVITLPLLGASDSFKGTEVLWYCYENFPEMAAEYEEFKVIMLYSGPNNIINTNVSVTSVEDLQGLKLRAASGTATDILQLWGATPMSISSSELYQSMEKNVIDGYIIDWTGVNSWNLYEVTGYYLDMPFFTQTWCMIMNKDSYNSLPSDLQALIDEYSTYEWSEGFAQVNEDEADAAREEAAKTGTVTYLTLDDDLSSFEPACEEYTQTWIESHSTDTFDAAEYVQAVKDYLGTLD